MRLPEADILALYERCRRYPALQRAVVLLDYARLEAAVAGAAATWPVDLQDLSLGQLNVGLLRLYGGLFSPQLHCQVRCPACRQEFEFELPIDALVPEGSPAAAPWSERFGFADGELELRLRPLTAADFAAIAAVTEPELASTLLAERLITGLRWHGSEPAPRLTGPHGRLLADLVARISESLAQQDPLAELSLSLSCLSCGTEFSAPLSPADFLWAELAAQARQISYQVHTLASAYGWSEGEILSLGEARRQTYMEWLTT